MKRLILYLMTGMCVASATAQNVTYNHDSAKQNQFTVAEIGSGSLTPDLYYTLLHNSYRKTALAKNKLSFRTTLRQSSPNNRGSNGFKPLRIK